MNRRNAGFTFVELLIVIAIFGFVLAGTSQMFVSILTTQRQQSRITESNIEGIIGLELLRQDLGKAGYGLPWNGLTSYTEVITANPYNLNDSSALPPRGIVSANDVAADPSLAGTDYLVIRATNVAANTASGKWTFLSSGASGTTTSWMPVSENLSPNDRVIVLSPGVLSSASARNLVASDTLFSNVAAFADTGPDNETRIVYGIDPDPVTNLSRPFNRADYFINRPATGMPQRCAAGTGILYKAVVNQNGGGLQYMPLLDCVADMQVVFRMDRDGDGQIDSGGAEVLTDSVTGLPLDAEQIRTQTKEVRVYILAQEGQMDRNYTHSPNPIYVGGDPVISYSLGRNFNFTSAGITNWQNYRWKIYTLVVKLDNLM